MPSLTDIPSAPGVKRAFYTNCSIMIPSTFYVHDLFSLDISASNQFWLCVWNIISMAKAPRSSITPWGYCSIDGKNHTMFESARNPCHWSANKRSENMRRQKLIDHHLWMLAFLHIWLAFSFFFTVLDQGNAVKPTCWAWIDNLNNIVISLSHLFADDNFSDQRTQAIGSHCEGFPSFLFLLQQYILTCCSSIWDVNVVQLVLHPSFFSLSDLVIFNCSNRHQSVGRLSSDEVELPFCLMSSLVEAYLLNLLSERIKMLDCESIQVLVDFLEFWFDHWIIIGIFSWLWLSVVLMRQPVVVLRLSCTKQMVRVDCIEWSILVEIIDPKCENLIVRGLLKHCWRSAWFWRRSQWRHNILLSWLPLLFVIIFHSELRLVDKGVFKGQVKIFAHSRHWLFHFFVLFFINY